MNTETADQKYERWKSIDPFPSIPPALLNSADIEDYINVTGMLDPFRKEKNGHTKLKSASYEVDLLGRVVYWDQEGKKIVTELTEGRDSFKLPRNSIAFVDVEPYFRLPDYIAVRFNLKIIHVHRGILLGTGPLIDPGFQGQLCIPLHNLTDNEYEFRASEGLIWMEFTKLSWPPPGQVTETQDAVKRTGKFERFPLRKLQRTDCGDYLRRADPHRPIRSSIPVEVSAAKKSAEEASTSAKRLFQFGSLSIFIAIVTVGAFLIQVSRFISDVRDRIGTQSEQLTAMERSLSTIKQQVAASQNDMKDHSASPNDTASRRDVTGDQNNEKQRTTRSPSN